MWKIFSTSMVEIVVVAAAAAVALVEVMWDFEAIG